MCLVLTMWIVMSPVEVLDYINMEVYFNLLYFSRNTTQYTFCCSYTMTQSSSLNQFLALELFLCHHAKSPFVTYFLCFFYNFYIDIFTIKLVHLSLYFFLSRCSTAAILAELNHNYLLIYLYSMFSNFKQPIKFT